MPKYSTQGARLQVLIASTWSTILARKSLKPNQAKKNKVDLTDLDSEAEESMPGILRGGEFGLSIYLDEGTPTHAYLSTSFYTASADPQDAIESWRYITNKGSIYPFDGWISGLANGAADTDGAQMQDIEITITGPTSVNP